MLVGEAALRTKWIFFLCFLAISQVKNLSYEEDQVTGNAFIGHYLSLLPGGVDLDDITSRKAQSYGDLSSSGQDKSNTANLHVSHKCKYCMQRLKKGKKTKDVKRTRVKGMFSWPIDPDRFWISCYYGRKSRGRLHKGVDLAALTGTPVRASAPGVVVQALSAGTFGNMVLIKHKNGYKSRYAHLQSITVRTGALVPRGKLIGYVGNTGRVSGKTGEHLHFEILSNNKAVNPMRFLA